MTVDVFAPARLGPVTLRNRVIKAATFEGRTPDALVTDDLIAFHRMHAAGGVGMTTVAYCAVAPDGRTEAGQLHWRPEVMPGMRRLTDAVHAEGAAIAAQIGHAGPVADAASTRHPAIGPGRMFNAQSLRVTRAATSGDLERVTAAHGRAARMARDAGFDAVEIHLGHNYLASSFLSPRLNRRTDEWGGPLEHRARLARDILRVVRDAVGGEIAVTAKFNMTDGVRGGLRIEESLQVARWLEADGGLDAIELTAGSSLLNPMYLFRGDAPVEEFAAAYRQPARFVVKRLGGRLIREYPYRPAYLLEDARRFRAELTTPLILLGGITDRAGMDLAMDEGFAFVAMGRALLREPDLVNRIRTEAATESLCVHCNRCMPTIFSGTHCVYNDVIPRTPRRR